MKNKPIFACFVIICALAGAFAGYTIADKQVQKHHVPQVKMPVIMLFEHEWECKTLNVQHPIDQPDTCIEWRHK